MAKEVSNEEFHEKIIVRAIKDKKFKEELKKNPKEVIEKELKIKLPKDFKLEILEEEENSKYIVIPKMRHLEKLSEEDLKKAAGGVNIYSWYINKCYDTNLCHTDED